MKYYSVNRLFDFDFYHSKLSFLSWFNEPYGNHLKISAKHIKVRKDAEPNKTGNDVEIENTCLSFYDFKIEKIKLIKRPKNEEYNGEQLTVYTGDKAYSVFQNELKNTFSVVRITYNNSGYELRALGKNSYFSVIFTFSDFESEWDDPSETAWYELNQTYKNQLTLGTPIGNISIDSTVTFPDEDVYHLSENTDDLTVSVGLNYHGSEYWGYGKDYEWLDAFADLQKKLPDGFTIRCCLTCRHGNTCPFGNLPGEFFCTKDLDIKQKNDLFFCTGDDNERKKRSRYYSYFCNDYAEQSKDYFTYNDYLYYLKS